MTYEIDQFQSFLHPKYDVNKSPYICISNTPQSVKIFLEEIAEVTSKASEIYNPCKLDKDVTQMINAVLWFDVNQIFKLMEKGLRISKHTIGPKETKCEHCTEQKNLIGFGCGHLACRDCFRKKWEDDITKKNSLPSCIDPNCRSNTLPDGKMMREVGLKIEEIGHLRFKESETTQICCGIIHYLPFNYPFYITTYQCGVCKNEFCFRCSHKDHIPVSCLLANGFHMTIQNLFPLSSIVKYRRMRFQDCVNMTCSQVSIPFPESSQTKEMKCERCKSRWCFDCGQVFENSDDFSSHPNRCPGVIDGRPYTQSREIREELTHKLSHEGKMNPSLIIAFFNFCKFTNNMEEAYQRSLDETQVRRHKDSESRMVALKVFFHTSNFLRNLTILLYYLKSDVPLIPIIQNLRKIYRSPKDHEIPEMKLLDIHQSDLDSSVERARKMIVTKEEFPNRDFSSRLLGKVKPIYDLIRENLLVNEKTLPVKHLWLGNLSNPYPVEYFTEKGLFWEIWKSMKRAGGVQKFQEKFISDFPKDRRWSEPALPPPVLDSRNVVAGGGSFQKDLEMAKKRSLSQNDDDFMLQIAINESLRTSADAPPPPPPPRVAQLEEEIEGEEDIPNVNISSQRNRNPNQQQRENGSIWIKKEVEKEKDSDQILGKRKIEEIENEEEDVKEEPLDPPEKKRKLEK